MISTLEQLSKRFQAVRNRTVAICESLETEDFVAQPTPDVSPPKWHLGHTTWFYECFILTQFCEPYIPFNENYNLIFNSYYKGVGPHWIQAERGYLSRPTVADVMKYRLAIDDSMRKLFQQSFSSDAENEIITLVNIGLNHEQQHQELLLMDIKSILATTPLAPVYRQRHHQAQPLPPVKKLTIPEGVFECGNSDDSFAFDNEFPRHKVWLNGCEIDNRPVSCGEFLEFINDHGYQRPQLWLADGWSWVNQNKISHPLYWKKRDDTWHQFTLNGAMTVDANQPLAHVSFFEADAFARWRQERLPTEFELEWLLAGIAENDFTDKDDALSPHYFPVTSANADFYLAGIWEWSGSPYRPYPGYRVPSGTIGEYNGKFMCNQFVLRGGSFASPKGHVRSTYRNFFYPEKRWSFCGLRLAKD